MTQDGIGQSGDVTCEDVLTVLDKIEKPVATATVLAEMLKISKQFVLRRLLELHGEGRIERWKIGSRAVAWWPIEEP